jgi:transposase
MKQKIVYIGLDVDDTQYHRSALNKESSELLSFRCRPALKGLLEQLAKVRKHFPRYTLKVAYEASYIGFTLQRDLADRGIHCDVVAPSSIPRQGGKAVKTDRIDAAQLAQFYANDLLTIVQVPESEMEQDRDLLRSRQSLMHQRSECVDTCKRYCAAMACITKPRPSTRATGRKCIIAGWSEQLQPKRAVSK